MYQIKKNLHFLSQKCPFPLRSPRFCCSSSVVPVSELSARRETLFSRVTRSQTSSEHFLIVPSAMPSFMSFEVPCSFRQSADFYYLTGICQKVPCILVLHSKDSLLSTRSVQQSVLFVQETSDASRRWDGPLPTAEEFVCSAGVDRVLPLSEAASYLNSVPSKEFWVPFPWDPAEEDFHSQPAPQQNTFPVLRALRDRDGRHVHDLLPSIHRLRAFKSPFEQQQLRLAAKVTAAAFLEVMRFSVSNEAVCASLLFAIYYLLFLLLIHK